MTTFTIVALLNTLVSHLTIFKRLIIAFATEHASIQMVFVELTFAAAPTFLIGLVFG
jgi:hypothetical protein